MKQLTILIVILTASWFNTAHSADIHVTDCSETYCVYISGEITSGDYDRILSIALYKKAIPQAIFGTSPGGDVVEAIKIGRFIRKGLISFQPGNPCNSACALIAFSSIHHEGGLSTTLGLHRPRYENEYFAGLNLGEANNEYKKLDDLVISYLKEMGVPTAISEKIMSTPSNRAVFMTTDEYIELAGSRPPAFDEWLIAQCGSMSRKNLIYLILVHTKLLNLRAHKDGLLL